MEIKRDDPERRKAFRARHNCSNPGPKWKAKFWSCKLWSQKKVSDIVSSSSNFNNLLNFDWDGETLWDQQSLINEFPFLKDVEIIESE